MNTQTEYKGDLKGFPQEIVQRLLDIQVKQGNGRDITVFERNLYNNVKGVQWSDTEEGHLFWRNVLAERDFGKFFDKYPKQFNPKRGDMVLVWDDLSSQEEAIFLASIEGAENPYLVVSDQDEDEFFTNKPFNFDYYKYMEIIPQKVKLTLQDISDGKGVGVDPKLIKIIE